MNWICHIRLGYFTKYEDACACREKAELKYFGKFSTLYENQQNSYPNIEFGIVTKLLTLLLIYITKIYYIRRLIN